MYRSNRKSEDMSTERFPTFVEADAEELPHRNGDVEVSQSFFDRFMDLPLVRDATNRIQDKYQSTKERSDFLRNVLERGESTVAFSLGQAAKVLESTGIRHVIAKPLNFVDCKAVQMLDTVEKKLPFIGQTQYEIKLAFRDKIEGTYDQISTVRENIRNVGTQALENVKHRGEIKVQEFLETPVGQTVNQKLENALNTADEYVDKVLPEGHSHMNGKSGLSNGSTPAMNGFHNGNLEHAKCLTAKLSRRVSLRVASKSHDLVDAVKRNSIVSAGKDVYTVAHQKTKQVQNAVSRSVFGVISGLVNIFAVAVDSSLFMLSKVLPVPVHEKLTLTLDSLVSQAPKRPTNGHVVRELHEE